MNSITPSILSAETKSFFFSSYSIALTLDGYSMILNTFVAATTALPISGPRDIAVPAYDAPKRIAKIAAIMFSGLMPYLPVDSSKLSSITRPPK